LALPKLSLLALASCALLVAACGGSSAATSSASTARRPSFLALAKCMRAHGVPNFPDPTGSGSGPRLQLSITPGSTGVMVNGVKVDGPAFQTAQRQCRSDLPGSSGPPPKLTAAERRRILAFAKCMRSNGVPNFPDPTFGSGFVKIRGPEIDPGSPGFRHARQVCGGPLGAIKGPHP
jgi:hypothetical protein